MSLPSLHAVADVANKIWAQLNPVILIWSLAT